MVISVVNISDAKNVTQKNYDYRMIRYVCKMSNKT